MIWSRPARSILIVGGRESPNDLRPGFLTDSRIRVLHCVEEKDAETVARRQRPSLIVVDLAGADQARLDLCRSLALDAQTRALPRLLVVPAELAEQVAELDADAMVRSPVAAREYHGAVGRFLPLPRRREVRHCINLRFSFVTDECTGQAFSRDLSARGAFLKTDRVLTPGTVVALRFRLPGEQSEVACEAVVRHSMWKGSGPDGCSGFAIEFSGLGEQARERLRAFVESHAPHRVAGLFGR